MRTRSFNRRSRGIAVLALAGALGVGACGADSGASAEANADQTTDVAVAETTASVTTATPTIDSNQAAHNTTATPAATASGADDTATPAVPSTTVAGLQPERPAWLGTRPLPMGLDGVALPQVTPPELIDRQLPSVDTIAPPPEARFTSTIGPLEGEALERSTWNESCPVEPSDLRLLGLTFWGFDDRPHHGEMIVHHDVAEDLVVVFDDLFEARFPIEEMRIVTDADLNARPTGDGNNTSAFVCRAVTGGTTFSEHASGLAIDVNPFHNPYVKNTLLLPELAQSFLDRSDVRPGMIVEGDVVVSTFDEIGWGWGGRWGSLKDYQHFALNNR